MWLPVGAAIESDGHTLTPVQEETRLGWLRAVIAATAVTTATAPTVAMPAATATVGEGTAVAAATEPRRRSRNRSVQEPLTAETAEAAESEP